MVQGEKERIRFRSKSVELELAVEFSREGKAGSKVGIFAVLDFSGEAKVGDQRTHKVKLVLEPVQSAVPDQPASGATAGTAGQRPAAGASPEPATAVSRLTVGGGADGLPRFRELVLRLPEHAEAQLLNSIPDAMHHLGAAGGAGAGSAPQVGAIEFTDAGGAFASALSGVMQDPDDPRHAAIASIVAEIMANDGGTRGG